MVYNILTRSSQKTVKTEHTGAKNRGGYWGLREKAKTISRKLGDRLINSYQASGTK